VTAVPDAPDQPRRTPWPGVILVALVVAFSLLLAWLGLPSPVLFGSLAAGLGYALIAPTAPKVPLFAFTSGQAVLGAAIGATLEPDTISSLRADWFPVLLSCVATLFLSVAAGYVLRLKSGISTATGVFAMVAEGASGLVAIAHDLGADDRVVAVVQYLRVLIILLGMPLVAHAVFHPPTLGITIYDAEVFDPTSANAPPPVFFVGPVGVELAPHWAGLAVAGLSLLIGLPLARLIAFPAGALLFPLIVAAILAGTGTIGAGVPNWLENVGFALIGLQVGLRFTQESLKAVATVLPLAIVTIIGMVAISAGFGMFLAEATDRSRLDGYLATTPGGLYAVLATAVSSGSDVTFVLMVQIARLFVMLFSAPLLARLIAGRKT
jgi:membrane AbrB-like protein